jgi:hypothetical protein
MAWSSIKSAAVKVRSFLRALWSLFWLGEVTLQTYQWRKAECLDCSEHVETERGAYCQACECPQWFMSDLRTKWRLLDLKCPLDKR